MTVQIPAPQMQCITSSTLMKLAEVEEIIGIVFLWSPALIQPLGCFDPIVQWDMCRGDKEHLRLGMVKNISGLEAQLGCVGTPRSQARPPLGSCS